MNTPNQYLELIDNLLSDKSFPSMIKIDGDWGTGKSYFVKTFLVPHLKKKKKSVKYFSLAGISSLGDFQNKIIASKYISESENPTTLGDIGKVGVALFGKITDSEQYMGLMGGLSGAIKEATLSRIDNCTFIMDDLERVKDDDVIAQVLGECLQISDERDVDFIFIANAKKLSNINADLFEKAFSDIISFKPSYKNTVAIVFGDKPWLEKHYEHIEKTISQLELNNIRILKRAKNKITKLQSQLAQISDKIYLDQGEKTLIDSILQVSHAFYISKFSTKDILNGFGEKYFPEIKKEGSKDPFEKYNLNFTPSLDFIEFCCSTSPSLPEITQSLRIHYKNNPIDELIYTNFSVIDEEECGKRIDDLLDYIFASTEAEITQYFEACDKALSLIEMNYIGQEKIEILERIRIKSNEIKFTETTTTKWRSRGTTNVEISNLMHAEMEKINKATITKENEILKEKLESSWNNIDMEIFQNHSLSPFINKFSAEDWLKFIDKWNAYDKALFADHIKTRYKATNIGDYLSVEMETLSALATLLLENVGQLQAGPKKGNLVNIINSLEFACSKLKKSDAL